MIKILLSVLAILFSMVVISLVHMAYSQEVITPDNTGNSNTLQSPSLPYCSIGERDNCQSIPQNVKIPLSEISTTYNINGAE